MATVNQMVDYIRGYRKVNKAMPELADWVDRQSRHGKSVNFHFLKRWESLWPQAVNQAREREQLKASLLTTAAAILDATHAAGERSLRTLLARERLATYLDTGAGNLMQLYADISWLKRLAGQAYKLSNPLSLYQAFHGNPPARARKVKLPIPQKGERLIKIGRLHSVIYEPERPSQHRGKLFEHKLGDTGERMLREKPILATDSQGQNLYIIPDKARPKFTKRGIIG